MAGLRRHKKKRHMLEIGLNITSLIDVLVVLIFFLVKSVTVTSSAVSTPPGIKLPSTNSETKVEESTSVSLSSTQLRVNNEVVLEIHGGFKPSDLENDKRTVKSLRAALEKERNKKTEVFRKNGDTNFVLPGKILVQADKDIPFDTLKYLLHTTAASGFTDYQFVVTQKSEN